jgi:hypothetical protein
MCLFAEELLQRLLHCWNFSFILLYISSSNKLFSKISIFFSVNLMKTRKKITVTQKKMSWIELLKIHSIIHISLSYCELMWVQSTSFRRVIENDKWNMLISVNLFQTQHFLENHDVLNDFFHEIDFVDMLRRFLSSRKVFLLWRREWQSTICSWSFVSRRKIVIAAYVMSLVCFRRIAHMILLNTWKSHFLFETCLYFEIAS